MTNILWLQIDYLEGTQLFHMEYRSGQQDILKPQIVLNYNICVL